MLDSPCLYLNTEHPLLAQQSNNYQVYGLRICTNQPIPGLVPTHSLEVADITIELVGQQQKEVPSLGKADWSIHPNWSHHINFNVWQASGDDGTYLRLQFPFVEQEDEWIKFIINPNGSRVWAFWSKEALFPDVVALLLGFVLGCVLLLRGVLCLHASVVSIDGKAIAILGHSGAGKSTTAAALALRGFPVLADDIAALRQDGTRFWVQPGYPRLRLCTDAVSTFGSSAEELSKVSIYVEKRYLDLSINGGNQWQFEEKPLPLSAIYLLGQRDPALVKPESIPISQSEAFLELAANVYGKRMLNKERLPSHFQQLSQLAQVVPMRILVRPNDLGSLSLLCDYIVEDFNQLIF